MLRRAEEVLAALPNVKAYVSEDGEVELTDMYGREIDVEMTGWNGLPVEVFENIVHDPMEKLRYKMEKERAKLQKKAAMLQRRHNAMLLRSAGGHQAAPQLPLARFRIALDDEF